jgi:hypothetical protein
MHARLTKNERTIIVTPGANEDPKASGIIILRVRVSIKLQGRLRIIAGMPQNAVSFANMDRYTKEAAKQAEYTTMIVMELLFILL